MSMIKFNIDREWKWSMWLIVIKLLHAMMIEKDDRKRENEMIMNVMIIVCDTHYFPFYILSLFSVSLIYLTIK